MRPSGQRTAKLVCIHWGLEIILRRTVPPNINRYPMGLVANIQVKLEIAELNKIKHILCPYNRKLFIDLNVLSCTVSI